MASRDAFEAFGRRVGAGTLERPEDQFDQDDHADDRQDDERLPHDAAAVHTSIHGERAYSLAG